MIVFSAIAKVEFHTVVMDVSRETFGPLVQAAAGTSCTTRGLAPTAQAICDACGIKMVLMIGPDGPSHDRSASDGAWLFPEGLALRPGMSGSIIHLSTHVARTVAEMIFGYGLERQVGEVDDLWTGLR